MGLSFASPLLPQTIGYPDALYTKPEKTRYQETSLHADVMNFVQMLSAGSEMALLEVIGTSKEGREIPLVVMADPPVSSPSEAASSGKPVIYIQANIHGGEVEGKEASMIMMRDIAFGQKRYLLEDQIIVFCPVFNADGNDALGPNNRPNQDGSPLEAGERYSGEGLDLNRDGIKLESIEGKALMKNVILRWDPHMFVDLHTTNGTWHGYSLTYAPGMNTAGHPGTTEYLMEKLFPEVTEKVRERSGLDTYLYGNFSEFPPETYNGMLTLPRYLTNALALRNMLTILVETFSHDRFERRILSNLAFLTSLLEYTGDNASEIIDLISGIDNDVITTIGDIAGTGTRGVQFQRAQSGPLSDLLVYDTGANIDQFGIQRPRRTGRRYWVNGVRKMTGVETLRESVVPAAYVFPADLRNVAEKLREHGLVVTELMSPGNFTGEEFMVTTFSQSPYNYQGHNLTTIDGSFSASSRTFPPGSYYVDMAQANAWLCFYLLEPQTDDGLTVWNYFDQYLIDNGIYERPVAFPVFKVFESSMSTNQSAAEDIISILMNPITDEIEIDLKNIAGEPVRIQLIDLTGRVVFDQKFPAENSRVLIPARGSKPGIYLIKIYSGRMDTVRKIAIN